MQTRDLLLLLLVVVVVVVVVVVIIGVVEANVIRNSCNYILVYELLVL